MATFTKHNWLIPVIRINDQDFGGNSLDIQSQEYAASLNAGINPGQFTGNVTFDATKQELTITNGQFFIVNLATAIARMGSYHQIRVWGDTSASRVVLNSTELLRGVGNVFDVTNRNGALREGWNTVTTTGGGGLVIKGPFLVIV